MLPQVILMGKQFTTHIAFMCFRLDHAFIHMYVMMGLQVAHGHKAFLADLTLVGSVSCMSSHVQLEAVSVSKGLGTLVA